MGLLAYLNKWARNVTGYDSVTRFGGTAHRIHAVTAVNLSGASIGTAGTIGDTFLSAVLIPAHATTATTVTLTGFAQDETGAAVAIVLTGSTTADTLYQFDQMLNYALAAQVTVNNADSAVIWHGAP